MTENIYIYITLVTSGPLKLRDSLWSLGTFKTDIYLYRLLNTSMLHYFLINQVLYERTEKNMLYWGAVAWRCFIKSSSETFGKIYGKSLVLDSLVDKAAGVQRANFRNGFSQNTTAVCFWVSNECTLKHNGPN